MTLINIGANFTRYQNLICFEIEPVILGCCDSNSLYLESSTAHIQVLRSEFKIFNISRDARFINEFILFFFR